MRLDLLLQVCSLLAYSVPSSTAELGDYDPYKHMAGYVSEYRFVPDQKEEMEEAIEQIHKTIT